MDKFKYRYPYRSVFYSRKKLRIRVRAISCNNDRDAIRQAALLQQNAFGLARQLNMNGSQLAAIQKQHQLGLQQARLSGLLGAWHGLQS